MERSREVKDSTGLSGYLPPGSALLPMRSDTRYRYLITYESFFGSPVNCGVMLSEPHLDVHPLSGTVRTRFNFRCCNVVEFYSSVLDRSHAGSVIRFNCETRDREMDRENAI